MNEPTIDEMIAWVEHQAWVDHSEMLEAVLAILKKYRDTQGPITLEEAFIRGMPLWQIDLLAKGEHQIKLEAIRAFVERVTVRYAQDKRYEDIQDYLHLMLDEVAAMEKEAETE